MLFNFPFYRQRDSMDCGPACLMMISAAWGKKYPLTYLRDISHINREGVSAQGIIEAGEAIGLRGMAVKVAYNNKTDNACLLTAPLPCIAHWNQQHFVVIYKVNKNYVWIADPAAGKFKLSRQDFEKSWLGDRDKGVIILFEPTNSFYNYSAQYHLPPGAASESAQIGPIIEYTRPYQALIIQILIGMAVSSMLLIVFPFLTQSIIDFGIDNRNIGFIYLVLFAQLALFFSQTIVQFLQSRIFLFMGARINIAMVHDFLAKLMRLPLGYFDTKMTGDLMQRIGDQARIEAFLTHSALPVMFSSLNFIIFSAILLLYNPVIFGVFALAAVLYVVWVFFFLKRRKELDYVRFQQSSENNNTIIELIQGMQEIKLQGSERKRRWLWASIQAKLFQTNVFSLSLSQWQDAGAALINQTKNIVITFLAAKAVIDGEMSLGMMLATQYMVGQLDLPLQQFIGFIRAAQDAKISLERMNEIQNQPDENTQLSNGLTITPPGSNHQFTTVMGTGPIVQNGASMTGDIQLEGVSFRYNALSDNVLNNIDLCIPRGKVTAIVGVSGSGKTTLVKLLLGFYQPTTGKILVGNTRLAALSPANWRKQCGAVMQDGFVFSDTIANNIAECDEFPDTSRLLAAVETANIRTFVEELPLGYNTKIGATGNGISQGQRQRLLIARAVYKNPEYLFLDEATNALDGNNEKTIADNLQDFYKNRTVVIVAHRLSTVRHADQIVVLHRGNLTEQGTHESLTAKRGDYFHLVKNQLELGV